MEKLFSNYIDKILELPEGKITKENILNDSFLLNKADKVEIYYAPHNEYTNVNAKIVTELAFQQARKDLKNNVDTNTILRNCKKIARFAGSMRSNLIQMLNELNLPEKIRVTSIAELFNDNDILHTTSLIPYPVFINGKNYNGHKPLMSDSSLFMSYICNHFFEEIKSIEKPLIIPLGKAVEDILNVMIEKNNS